MAILGLARLNRKLKAIPQAVQAEIAKAMEESAQEVVNLAKSLVPVGSGGRAGSKKVSRHGALRDSIGWTWGDAPKGSIVLGTVKQRRGRSANNMRITIFAGNDEAWYARFVEFGTRQHIAGGKFAGATIPNVSAQPFFYVSYRAVRKKVRGRVSRAVTKAAKRVAAGG